MAARKIQPHKSKRKCGKCGKPHTEAEHRGHYWPIRKKKASKKKGKK